MISSIGLAGSHVIAGVGATYGADDDLAAQAEAVVRRVANRHRCGAPTLFREVLASEGGAPVSQSAAALAEQIRLHPERYCDDPRHDDDAAWLAEALQWLGLRPTPPPRRRPNPLTARPNQKRPRGGCPQCHKRAGLRGDGTLGAHGGCLGEGMHPKEET